jgi:hypothetical protein
MRIRRCDFCGEEIIEKHHDANKSNNPSDRGWCVLEGRKLCSRWEKDICPKCVPKENG